MKNNLYVVVLAGGSGTRFWPLSRESYPKQFLKLTGDKTMIQRTMAVARKLTNVPERICIVTHEQQADAVRLQLNWSAVRSHPLPQPPPSGGREGWGGRLSTLHFQLLLEPAARNTAPAIGLAASKIFQQDPEAILAVMPADHVIRKVVSFIQAMRKACWAAEQGFLVTFGIKPTRPETGFGYIKKGRAIKGGGRGIREVAAFVEKPDTHTARRYLRSGRYDWNSGIFVFKAREILKAIQRYQPLLAQGLKEILKARDTEHERKIIQSVYRGLPSVSIDYGIMERIENGRIAVVSTDMGWSDVGSWAALDEILPKNNAGNIIRGNVIDIGCRDSILYADRRPVAVVGTRGMVVVDTPDATLVCPKSQSQEIRKVVAVLKKKQAEELLAPRTVERPWGTFTVIENGNSYKIKRIMVRPGARLSLQLHRQRSEHWVVVQGVARVTRNDEVFDVQTYQSTYIPRGAKHRIENPGRKPLQIIEVQNGDYLGEDDIVRFQDDYGRDVKR